VEVPLTHDVVPLEHRAGLVSADPHGDSFRYARPNQVPYTTSPEVVKQPVRPPSLGGEPGDCAG
jgi:hypothetical protein